MDTPDKIARWLKANRMTQADLADKAGIPPNRVSNIINRSHGPTERYIIPMARAMGVSLDWLYRDEYDWPPPPALGSSDAVVLTEAQRKVLDLATVASEDDPEPADLKTARRLLMRIPTAAGGEARSMPPDGVRTMDEDDRPAAQPKKRGRSA